MGGSNKSNGSAAGTTGTAQPVNMAFTVPDNGATIANQLQQGGLLSAIGNPGLLYRPVNVPILNNPAELRGWMLSKGMSYVDDAGKTVNPPKSSGGSTPSKPSGGTATPPKINVGGR